MGCQRLVRVSSWLCDEARVASVFSRLYHGMREGRGGGVDPGPGSRTGVMDTRARGGGSLSHIKYTRGGSSPRCHPSTRSSTCGLPSRAYRASPTIFFPPFPSLETYPFRFYLSLSPNPFSLSLSSSLLASFPPRYYSSFAPRASSLCFFVPFAASSPFLPTLSVSPKTSPKTLLESSSASFFPPLPLFLLAHSSLLCIRLSPFPALSIAYISYRVEIATRAFHFLPEIPLFPFLSSSRDLHSFRRQSHFIYRARFLHDLFRSFRR